MGLYTTTMSGDPVMIQLSWADPMTGEIQHASQAVPVAIGRERAKMPDQLDEQPVSQLELNHQEVSRYHALITVVNQQLYVTDKSANGTYLNGRLVRAGGQAFSSKDTLRVGPCKITATRLRAGDTNATALNREHSHLARAETADDTNALLIWLGVGTALLLLGVGLWLGARTFIDRARPKVEPENLSHWPATVPYGAAADGRQA